MKIAGIDAGSRTLKIVIWDVETRRVVTRGITDQGVAQVTLAEELLQRLLHEQGFTRADLAVMVATGYGRHQLQADLAVTEITCHAQGVRHMHPEARTVVEIGGQDSKIINLGVTGDVDDFSMNDRCAAGTGRFLEAVAQRLLLPLNALGDLARQSSTPAVINSTCVVFAETEIIGLLAAGASPADLVAGVQASMARRIAAMAGRLTSPIVFTGGVALVPGMAQAISVALGDEVRVAEAPQFTGALGACLAAERKLARTLECT